MDTLLIYEFVPDYLDRRPEFRGAHLKLAWESVERGELQLGGATGAPPDGAVLWFRSEVAGAAERFARVDPYVTNGLVVSWRVVPWATVVGELAGTPVKPLV